MSLAVIIDHLTDQLADGLGAGTAVGDAGPETSGLPAVIRRWLALTFCRLTTSFNKRLRSDWRSGGRWFESSAGGACSNPEFRAVHEIEIAPTLDEDRPGSGAGADGSADRRTLASTGDRPDHRPDCGT